MTKAPAKTKAAEFHRAHIEGEPVPDGWENFQTLPKSQQQPARDALARHIKRTPAIAVELDEESRYLGEGER